jgi:hypothetical protein
MKSLTMPAPGTLLVATAGTVVAGHPHPDRVERRLDRHGKRLDDGLDRRGARFDRRH